MSNWFGGNLNGEESALCFTVDTSINTDLSPRRMDGVGFVDWGDGSPVEYYDSSVARPAHTYTTTGVYNVKVWTDAFTFIELDRESEITDIISFGDAEYQDVYTERGCFAGNANIRSCPHLKPSSPDFRNMSSASLYSFFTDCTNFNGNVEKWNISPINSVPGNNNSLRMMFDNARSFNRNIGYWDVSNVTYLRQIFWNAHAFNNGGSDSIGSWDVSSNTDLFYAFRNAYAFNQDIGDWDVSSLNNSIGLWATFQNASSFDQDISGWTVAPRAFATSTSFTSMLNDCGMSVTNYSRFLIGLANWAYDNSVSSKTFGASGLQYDNTTHAGIGSGTYTDAVSARAYLISQSWSITDAGQA